MNALKPALTLSLILAFLALAGGCSRPDAGKDAVRAHAPQPTIAAHHASAPAHREPPAVEAMSANALMQAFASSSVANASRLAHQALEIDGTVAEVTADGDGAPLVTLKSSFDANPQFALDTGAWSDAATLQVGGQVTLTCHGAELTAGRVVSTACSIVHVSSGARVAARG